MSKYVVILLEQTNQLRAKMVHIFTIHKEEEDKKETHHVSGAKCDGVNKRWSNF